MSGGAVILLNKSVRGDRIKRLREDRGWTQGQLSLHTEIAQSYISDMERGVAANVGTEALIPLARTLETSVDYLCGLTDDPRSPARKPLGELTAEEETMVRQYRAITDERARRLLRDFVASAVENRL